MSNAAENINKVDRGQAKIDAENKSKEADLKQHADKLVRGFENLDGASANRAIWELVQNACDLTAEAAEVIIDYSAGFSFSHNGKPFISETLISLIKQVSNKTSDESVGQFGTGFITTHAFGRKFKINSVLAEQGGFIEIKDFLVDRSAKDSTLMIDALKTQEKAVYTLIEEGKELTADSGCTTFTYLPESDSERTAIAQSASSLHSYIPLVQTLNPKLAEVKVIAQNGEVNTYKRENKEKTEGIWVTSITTEKDPISIYSLISDNGDIEVILPITSDRQALPLDSNVAKLFLYYPLIGTENFGCNFIIHSKRFAPTEPRDGIHLKSKTEQVQELEACNRNLIEQASRMIFEYLTANAAHIGSPINLATINFNVNGDKPLLNEYFKELKTAWIEEFKKLSLIDTESGNKTASEAAFLHSELLLDENRFESIYSLASIFWKSIPKKQIAKQWTRIIDEWNIETIEYKKAEHLADELQIASILEAFEDAALLKTTYLYFIEFGFATLFGSRRLLPNIKGEFKQLPHLHRHVDLPVELIRIADVIIPDIPKKFVHPDFTFNLEFETYSRKNYSTDINDSIAKKIGEKTISKSLAPDFTAQLIEYCKIVSTEESKSVPNKVTKLVCDYYKHNDQVFELPTLKEDPLSVKPAQLRLLRLCLNDVSEEKEEWVKQNLNWLEDIISIGYDYEDYKSLYQTLSVFPNLLCELREQTNLSIDSVDDEIKDIYDEVVKPSLPIRADLVHPRFVSYLVKQDRIITTRHLTEEIETLFSADAQYSNINEHPYKNQILKIVKAFGPGSKWSKYFPIMEGKRSGIMVDMVTDEHIKENVFTIMQLNASKINALGTLAGNENMERVISLGLEAVAKENQHQSTFEFLHDIGTRMEGNLRESLAASIPGELKCIINNVQDGQDIIVTLNGEPVYYIEVKSRWDIKSSVRLSRKQTLKAHAQRENYALCSIDMTKYQGADTFSLKTIEPVKKFIYFNIDIGSKVEHLINVLEHTNDLESIQLDGEYRTRVPMAFVETGKKLADFEEYLIEHIRKHIANDAQSN